jgi:phenylpyruvate tautomerase PptA (4-oxalocrotonate tautomerase family)
MPLWTIHHTPGVFSTEDKRQLAARIADQYESVGLPRFYVMTLFSEIAPDDFFVSGRPAQTAVRVVIEHIARHGADSAARRRIAQWISDLLTPYVGDPDGLHWEFHVDETSEELWMINGLVPPPTRSDAERRWAETNTAAPY